MPIEIAKERVITLRDAAQFLPKRRCGKRPHYSTVLSWARQGSQGVKLETIQVGGTLCTSVEALQRFCEALSQAEAAKDISRDRSSDEAPGDESQSQE